MEKWIITRRIILEKYRFTIELNRERKMLNNNYKNSKYLSQELIEQLEDLFEEINSQDYKYRNDTFLVSMFLENNIPGISDRIEVHSNLRALNRFDGGYDYEYHYSFQIKKVKKTREDQPLHIAIWEGDVEKVEMLLNQGANSNEKGAKDLPLHIAIREGYTRIVELLLKAGANPNAQDQNAEGLSYQSLRIAFEDIKIPIIKLLLEHGANPNPSKDDSLLHYAIKANENDALTLLLQYGANPNEKNWRLEYETPLTYAIVNNNRFAVEELLKHNANPNLTNEIRSGSTPLIIASKKGDVVISKMLLEKGANPNIDGKIIIDRPLAYFIKQGNIDGVKLILEYGGYYSGACSSNPEIKNLLELRFIADLLLTSEARNSLKIIDKPCRWDPKAIIESIKEYSNEELDTFFKRIEFNFKKGLVSSSVYEEVTKEAMVEGVYILKEEKEPTEGTTISQSFDEGYINDVSGKIEELNLTDDV
jgi:ankyrin repeat protein